MKKLLPTQKNKPESAENHQETCAVSGLRKEVGRITRYHYFEQIATYKT